MEDVNKLRKSVATVSASNQEKQNGRFVFLKTAVATVCSPSNQTQINILLDDGAQRSFVVKKIADRLKLEPVDEICVAFTHLGQTQPGGSYNIVKLNLVGDDGKLIYIEACVVDKIVTIPLRSELETASTLSHIRHLKLAHPIKQGGSFHVQLLIGADFYWDVVGNKVIRGPGPTAVESKLGYLLSGPLTVDECMDVEKKGIKSRKGRVLRAPLRYRAL